MDFMAHGFQLLTLQISGQIQSTGTKMGDSSYYFIQTPFLKVLLEVQWSEHEQKCLFRLQSTETKTGTLMKQISDKIPSSLNWIRVSP